jgi:hypothetical protein
MAERIVSFVMSGGVGSRLWPLSREDNPKQFHDLSGDGSMLVKTLRRLKARPEGETLPTRSGCRPGPITGSTGRRHLLTPPSPLGNHRPRMIRAKDHNDSSLWSRIDTVLHKHALS